MTYVTVNRGSRPEIDAEERRQRALHAKEILNGAGWVFDALVSALTEDLIDTRPDQSAKREELYHQINGARQASSLLEGVINRQEQDEKRHERKHRNDEPADHE